MPYCLKCSAKVDANTDLCAECSFEDGVPLQAEAVTKQPVSQKRQQVDREAGGFNDLPADAYIAAMKAPASEAGNPRIKGYLIAGLLVLPLAAIIILGVRNVQQKAAHRADLAGQQAELANLVRRSQEHNQRQIRDYNIPQDDGANANRNPEAGANWEILEAQREGIRRQSYQQQSGPSANYQAAFRMAEEQYLEVFAKTDEMSRMQKSGQVQRMLLDAVHEICGRYGANTSSQVPGEDGAIATTMYYMVSNLQAGDQLPSGGQPYPQATAVTDSRNLLRAKYGL